MATPTAIATWPFGQQAVVESGKVLAADGPGLDAVEVGIRLIELDPNEHSVGYGGLPNEAGVVQLDAAVMNGATHDAGAVAALEGFRSPISIARRVMEKSRHVLLVGEGARQFALAQGFKEEETLTDEARKRWEKWRSEQNGGTGHDTIGLVALDRDGDLAVGCSTSGIGFKEVGRVGDSPLLGCGLYADNDVGGAAATGLGEEIMKFCLSFLVVEFMRQGRTPQQACRAAIQRMLDKDPKYRNIAAAVIGLDREGRTGGYATHRGFSYAVWTPAGMTYHNVTIDH